MPQIPDTLDYVADGSSRLALLPAERSKLAGVAAGATANATDAQLRDRATHTGTQAVGTVSGLQAALDAKLAASAPVARTDQGNTFAGLQQFDGGVSVQQGVVADYFLGQGPNGTYFGINIDGIETDAVNAGTARPWIVYASATSFNGNTVNANDGSGTGGGQWSLDGGTLFNVQSVGNGETLQIGDLNSAHNNTYLEVHSVDGAFYFENGTLFGNGSGLTELNASFLGSGTVPVARLPATVSRTNAANTFTALQTFSGSAIFGQMTFASSGALQCFSPGNHGLVAQCQDNGYWAVVARNQGLYAFLCSGAHVIWATANGVDALHVTSAGNTGLGTQSPAEKLDVVGNVKASGTIKPGTINTATTPGTADGQLATRSSDGKLVRWNASTLTWTLIG